MRLRLRRLLGHNEGLLGIGDLQTNVCLTTVELSGSTIGCHQGLGIGAVSPAYTENGVLCYEISWTYPASASDPDGLFRLAWGDTGDVQLAGVEAIVTRGAVHADAAHWDVAQKAYIFYDTVLAQELNDAFDAGTLEPLCFKMEMLPSPFIHYTFSELKRGV